MATHCQMVTYYRRGLPPGQPPAFGQLSLESQAADLEAVLDALDIGTGHVIGSSAGGPIAIIFAATRPTRARSDPELVPVRGDVARHLDRRPSSSAAKKADALFRISLAP